MVAAHTLDEGVAWCKAVLGLWPESGGQHVFMGTHNRVFSIASPAFPRTYFEIISIDPSLPSPAHARWFDLDHPALRRSLACGPQLVHWVARCNGIEAARIAMRAGGIDCGEVHHAERATPHGLLRWQISLRADGRRPLEGTAPALIEWGDAHPTDTMAASGITLETLRVGGWPDALAAMLPATIERDAASTAPPLTVLLSGPHGRVTLQSARLEP